MKPVRRSQLRSLRTHHRSVLGATRLLLSRLEDRVAPAVLTLQQAAIAPVEGQQFNGTVATFTDSDATATVSHFTATINWGDGTATAGQVVADPGVAGQFDIQGTHTYADEGHPNVIVSVRDTVAGGSATTGSYSQSNLVTDNPTVLASLGFAPAAHTDAHLKNPWGIAFPATGPFWISDNAAGVSTLYDGAGNAQTLVVTIPASANAGATSPAPPTGVVFNGSATDFNVAGANTPARFIFATEDGTIAAWNSGTTAVLKVNNANFTTGPVYKGLAIGNNGTSSFLYATNFREGTIDVFDTNFAKVTLGSGGFGTFTDPTIPAGFAPFGIENIGGKLFVTYAKQDPDKKDDVAGAGNGFVDMYDLNGNFLQRLISQGALNSPWGLALAPATFGTFANDLLVGNFGNGLINAFNPTTGALAGQLSDAQNRPVSIDGLWALKFGNNGTAGGAGTLFFTAGINDEADGLFGRLSASINTVTVADAPLLPGTSVTTGVTSFSGVGGNNTSTTANTANAALAAFEAAIGGANNGGTPAPQAGGFRTINWDGVKLDGTDFGGQSTVIDPGHVVGIPVNRFKERGVQFEVVYAVGGPSSATDTSTFSTVNPTVANLFPAFSPANTFAMFNDNGIDFSFVRPSDHTTAPAPAASRGFGAIFRNVRLANTTSIEYFNGNTSLGKFFVPVGAAGQPEFLGELFNSPVVTRVSITLGTDVLFSFDGVHFSAGGIDDPATGHNLAVTDDFVYAEPAPLGGGQPTVNATAGVAFNNTVAVFTDTNPNAAATDFTGTIDWGDGQTSPAVFTRVLPPGSSSPFFQVSGSHTYGISGPFTVHVTVQDFGGSSIDLDTAATVGAVPPSPTKVHYFAVGAPLGAAPEVKVYDPATGAIKVDFLAYASDFRGGVRLAVGDVNGDGTDDIITGAGPGGGPHVKVFSGAGGSLLDSFFAYGAVFAGGVFVAAGDVNGDGKADIVTGAGPGGGPHVKVFSGADLAELDSFFAYGAAFAGGVTVAAGDLNGDGKADIITGAGAGGGPHVKVFSGADLAELASFFAFDAGFRGGVFVAAGDVNGDGKADIIAGAGAGGVPQVTVFSGSDLSRLAGFFAYDTSFAGGVRVAAADLNGDGKSDIITGAGPAGGPHVKAFDGTSLALLESFFAFDPIFRGGVFVG
ncbi:MAG TPA: TIGR03118 family protein [Gemmataceae bacterium]|nr:TIGR03118 family protein [Gemmataceae bacterium]